MMETEVNGIRLAYTNAGDGRPVVLLHGYQLDRTFWEPQVQALEGGYRVIVPDLRGFGSSELGDVSTSDMELMADDVGALLDQLGLREPIILGGLSMGGYVALAFVAKYAERVGGLILADTRAEADSDERRRDRRAMAE